MSIQFSNLGYRHIPQTDFPFAFTLLHQCSSLPRRCLSKVPLFTFHPNLEMKASICSQDGVDNPERGTQSLALFSSGLFPVLATVANESICCRLCVPGCLCSFCRLDLDFFSFLCLSILHSLIGIQYQLLSRASPSPPDSTVFSPHVARLYRPWWPAQSCTITEAGKAPSSVLVPWHSRHSVNPD